MPNKYLAEQEQKVSKHLRKNTLFSVVFAVAGFGLLIPAFSVAGTRIDQQEFCFQPQNLTNPEQHDFCTGEKIRKGIAWRVAQEVADSQQFKTKVKLLNYLPAQNPHAGGYGLVGAGFFFAAFVAFKSGTNQLENTLDVFVWNKKSKVLENALKNNQHIGIEQLKHEQELQFVQDLMTREHGDALYSLMSEPERELAAKRHQKATQLDDAQFDLQIASMKAQSAELNEKEVKHRKEIEKLSKAKKTESKANETSASEAAKEELISKLKEHEEGWLYTLVMSNKPLFIIGSQGSWKSYFAATVALCGYYLRGHSIVSICDPHFNKNEKKSWKEIKSLVNEVYGTLQDWESINLGIKAAFDRWTVRTEDDEPYTSIFDELTNYSKHSECAESSEEFMGRVLADPRKSNEGVIGIAHGFTNATNGGGSGFKETREEDSIQVRLNSDNNMKPLFKGKIIGFKDAEGELVDELKITIPKDWFNPADIKQMFGGNNA